MRTTVNAAPAYVLAAFKNSETLGDGLRVLTSTDALSWDPLPAEPLLLGLARTGGRVFRDPSIAWADGRFHLVFTSDLCVGQVRAAWRCERLPLKGRPAARFGYATSTDLVHWEGVRLVQVPLRAACSLWAPEVAVLPPSAGGGFVVFFSATQVFDGKCPTTLKGLAHRSWMVRSRDMRSFTPPRRILNEVSESAIDLFPIFHARPSHPSPHVLIFKSERNLCERREWTAGRAPLASRGDCTLVLRVATASNVTGPWRVDTSVEGSFFSGAISRPCAEGPTAVRDRGGDLVLLFDGCRDVAAT